MRNGGKRDRKMEKREKNNSIFKIQGKKEIESERARQTEKKKKRVSECVRDGKCKKKKRTFTESL